MTLFVDVLVHDKEVFTNLESLPLRHREPAKADEILHDIGTILRWNLLIQEALRPALVLHLHQTLATLMVETVLEWVVHRILLGLRVLRRMKDLLGPTLISDAHFKDCVLTIHP